MSLSFRRRVTGGGGGDDDEGFSSSSSSFRTSSGGGSSSSSSSSSSNYQVYRGMSPTTSSRLEVYGYQLRFLIAFRNFHSLLSFVIVIRNRWHPSPLSQLCI